MTKRIVFFDIDGTLLDRNKQLPLSASAAVRQLQSAGHDVVLATGRSPFMLADVARELNIRSYVGFNGQYVVWHGELIYCNPFAPDDLHRLSAFAERNRHPLVYLDHQDMRSSIDNHLDVETCFRSLCYRQPAYDPQFYRNRDIYQTMLFCREGEDEAYRRAFPELQFVRWHPLSLDILPGGGSKANGIKHMLHRLGHHPQDAYAFGDNLNDMEMLGYIGNSVAMGNAPDEVKRIARYVTPEADQHGIARGLRMVGLLPE
ncbi:Cof-type HAD-IIB family hydrolase [Paenibacillus protaetiae]|uniref:Cof-type HAD-IIB family hydrolase n=1 Tax=Paenibacillus protaetiae TaxID=2509456 RepID=A0A4P6F0G4_9BACL|nr:Cof-type HAD-IIB family hydrolase [Paenibacillus protaetiae]QAY68545.1 Cof-type HAD-IIB family hydrolase [Paenibacillus protaetiae]